jgi:hypothetical protein
MKQLGLVRAESCRERSALTKSEARKFINQLIAHPRIRQKASEPRPHEDISGYVIDHDLSRRGSKFYNTDQQKHSCHQGQSGGEHFVIQRD